MKFIDEDIQNSMPGTIKVLRQYDEELLKYGAEIINIRMSDTTFEHISFCLNLTSPLYVINRSSIIHELAILGSDEKKEDLRKKQKGEIPYEEGDIIRGLHNVIQTTCNNCGSRFAVNFQGDSRTEIYLCDYCASLNMFHPLDIVKLQAHYFSLDVWNKFKHYPFKVRILNPEGNFDYTRTDRIFFDNDNLYMISSRPGYINYDIRKKLGKRVDSLFPIQQLSSNDYIVPVIFAGVELNIRDIRGERIYSGDILFNQTHRYYGMAIFDPLCDTNCAVYHGNGSFPTFFDKIHDWEIKGNIIMNNPNYTGNQIYDYDTYYEDNKDFLQNLGSTE